MYNTRVAPSPTGDMHLGTARTAYFNWLAARASGGTFMLRIDDTDRQRDDEVYLAVILDTMRWLGLDYDSVAMQSTRFDRYNSVAGQLVVNGRARVVDGGAISLCVDMPDTWTDQVAGLVKTAGKQDEIIIIKSDGSPTYNFATVVDDHDHGINYVIRGSDHMANTPKQIAIYQALGWPLPNFGHVGLIHQNKRKLSKRDQAASMLYYRDQGMDPDAVLNFMLRLGWGPTVDDKSTKMIDRDRAIQLFLDGGKMRAASSNADMQMLAAFDRKYRARKENNKGT